MKTLNTSIHPHFLLFVYITDVNKINVNLECTRRTNVKMCQQVMPELDARVTWSVTRDDVKWFPIMSEAGLCFSTNTVALVNDAIL